jgi:hypothetical protein
MGVIHTGRADPGAALVPGRSIAPCVSRFEGEFRSPSVATQFRISDALEVRAADLVKRADAARRRKQGG